MKPQLILLGAPGSGKGTQAAQLVKNFKYNHISTGDLLRNEISKGSDLGLRVKKIMDQGQLVDDKIVLELLKANCDLNGKHYIFDGFPRNIDQAKALNDAVIKASISKAVYFKVDLDNLLRRIVNRRTCEKCGTIYNLHSKAPQKPGKCDSCGSNLIQRKDDNEEVMQNRLNVFKTTIEPVLEYYELKLNLYVIDASQEPSQVYEQLVNAIGK